MDLGEALDTATTKQADRATELAEIMALVDEHAKASYLLGNIDGDPSYGAGDPTDLHASRAAVEQRIRQVLDSRA